MSYVDGFVLVVPTKNLDAYRKMAEDAAKVWKEYGALEVKECVAEDLSPNEHCASFTDLAKPGKDETIVFSYIVYKSREDRDAVNTKVIADPRIQESCGSGEMPFDPKRMAYGGFKTIVSA